MYQERTYRQFSQSSDLVSFNIKHKETDLFISARMDLSERARLVAQKIRAQVESYIEANPTFLAALEPLPFDAQAPAVVRQMLKAAQKAGVGPMAAVAGAIAQQVAQDLSKHSPDLLVENGGDTYIYTTRERRLGIWAGEHNPFNQYALLIDTAWSPVSVCCSSGTVGHSFSFGQADAAIIISHNGALADAAATGLGNRTITHANFEVALDYAKGIEGVKGALVIKGDKMGAWGCIRLCRL